MPNTWNSVYELLPDWKEYSSLCSAGIHVFTVVGVFYSKTSKLNSGVHIFARHASGGKYWFFTHTWRVPNHLKGLYHRISLEIQAGDSIEGKVFILKNGVAKIEEFRKVNL